MLITTKGRVVLFHGLDPSSRDTVRVVRSHGPSSPETRAEWSWAEMSAIPFTTLSKAYICRGLDSHTNLPHARLAF